MTRSILSVAVIFLLVNVNSGIFFPPKLIGSVLQKFLNPQNDPTLYYSSEDFMCDAGYPFETHKVETEDGYILTLHRIPGGKRKEINKRVKRKIRRYHYGLSPEFPECQNLSISVEDRNRRPVLVQHGLLVASDSWLLQGPKNDLVYLLADAGYDVWLGNARGNYYSRAHRSLDPSDKKFWDFSFHEMGYYDVPASIDYILEKTQRVKLDYIGHSMGGTMFLVMATTRPEYNEKIRLFNGLAPASFQTPEYMSSRKKIVADALVRAVKAMERNGAGEWLPRVNWAPYVSHSICGRDSPFQDLCTDFTFFVGGINSKSFFRKTVPRITSHAPAGMSLKTISHYVQGVQRRSFMTYDHGEEINMQKYGQPTPLPYNLSKITCPVSIYYSTGDYLVDEKDILKLVSKLPKEPVNLQRTTKMNHLDYQFSSQAKHLVYSHLMMVMSKY